VREQYALRDGQTIKVTIEPDRSPRTVEPPEELAAALKQNATARAGWEAMSFTHKREWAAAVRDAKRAETRERRVAQAIEALIAKARALRTKTAGKKQRARGTSPSPAPRGARAL
jgi:uncharacterized protein YdeI (YjbR/CyaY-like superfamily)